MKRVPNQPKPAAPQPAAPRWADRFLSWYCRPELLEEIQGDVYELFDQRLETTGLAAARRGFVWDVLRSFRLSTIRHPLPSFSPAMFRNHLQVTVRHLRKQKFYTGIKVVGFALGLACCLLILLFIRHELGYDRFYPDADRLYRVIAEYRQGDRSGIAAFTTTPLAETLERDYPEVERAVRVAPGFYDAGSSLIHLEGETQNVYEEGFMYADPAFLDVFSFRMQQGNAATALTEPYSVVLTEQMAEKYFPDKNPVGQVLILNNNAERPYRITGVMENVPEQSHFRFQFVLSMNSVGDSQLPNWGYSNFFTYVRLQPEADAKALEAKLPEIVHKYIDPDGEAAKAGRSMRFMLQPVPEVYLYSSGIFDNGYFKVGDIQYVWLFAAVALFVLLIASINFINLSTAKSANRAREVGIRKVLGSVRGQLVSQFLTESVLLSVIAFAASLLLAQLALPFFNRLADQHLSLPFGELWFIPGLLLAALALGLLAGAYPSLFLSSFLPAQVLKGKLSQGARSGRLRSALVIVQFTTSIVLIIATLVVQQQMHYIQDKKLGFEKDQTLILEDTYALGNQIQPFKEALKNLPNVAHVTVTGFLPVAGYDRNNTSAWPEGGHLPEAEVGLAKWYVDHDYIPTLGMQMLEGRNFSLDFPSDSQAIILNKKAVAMLGWDDPIGQRVSSYTYLDDKTGELLHKTYTVIGVVEDFHYESMKQDIAGLSLVLGGNTGATALKVHTEDMAQLLEDVQQVWQSFAPTEPFRYHFLDEQFANMYRTEHRVGQLFAIFAGLAIAVACLGLFALAAFMAEQRTKEISVRKVLGASVHSLFFLLTRNFVVMVLVALACAIPLAWYLMHRWLQDFVYRTTIGWEVFAVAGLAALGVTLLTISYQAIRAAFLNPADTLRSE
ncbi:putative ABC transport system permease protein [Catalinimonas alkaloidigena]|uniref:Putative ABC transport system permease protein n=1 Tax=Catalinimonas alkaloidigena TaxID=1075417 RepID=A0A1G9N343_9BACT|nr:ABC transporter permease [Catalinimonas alkaloidigena]SDL80547.1 putative ABC transport system permease protein [Catalinimonas alkaloidigena]